MRRNIITKAIANTAPVTSRATIPADASGPLRGRTYLETFNGPGGYAIAAGLSSYGPGEAPERWCVTGACGLEQVAVAFVTIPAGAAPIVAARAALEPLMRLAGEAHTAGLRGVSLV